MSGFLKRNTNTVNPAGGVNPASNPNVGQYGWTSYDANNVNQIIEYVNMTKVYADQAKDSADYISSKYGEIKNFITYLEQIYAQIGPIFDNIETIYNDIVQKHTAVVVMHKDVKDAEVKVLEAVPKVEADSALAVTSAAEALVSQTEAAKSAKEAADVAEELRKGQVYRGTWNIEANAAYPATPDTNSVWDITLNEGSTQFSYDNTIWYWGDRLLYLKDDNKFSQIESGSGVLSVNGKTGAVTLVAADIGALDVTVAEAGDGSVMRVGGGRDLAITADLATKFSNNNLPTPSQIGAVNESDTAPGGRIYSKQNKPTTAEIGAFATTGGELSGDLIIKKDTKPQIEYFIPGQHAVATHLDSDGSWNLSNTAGDGVPAGKRISVDSTGSLEVSNHLVVQGNTFVHGNEFRIDKAGNKYSWMLDGQGIEDAIQFYDDTAKAFHIRVGTGTPAYSFHRSGKFESKGTMLMTHAQPLFEYLSPGKAAVLNYLNQDGTFVCSNSNGEGINNGNRWISYSNGAFDIEGNVLTKGDTINYLRYGTKHLWFKDGAGAEDGLLYFDGNDNKMRLRSKSGPALTVSSNGFTEAPRFEANNNYIGYHSTALTVGEDGGSAAFRGNIGGGGWDQWGILPTGLMVTCQNSTAQAHGIWKAQHVGMYNLAAMAVHSPGGDPNQTVVSLSLSTTFNQFMFYNNGTATATAGFHTGSDARFKERIRPLNSSRAKTSWLDKVCSLGASSFAYKSNSEKTTIGFIAQDVQAVLPEAVTVNRDTTLPVEEQEASERLFLDPLAIIAVQNEAIKELRDIVLALKEEVRTLQNQGETE